ncbi:hypothetical protein I7I50_08524 [Histoplasma capsulatum G186AR]|uniref:Uncharacterized protein n=1 Tax=Ajellomyces capsulatus TaxID=5037 RepID=A0A8H8CYZ7_AJECA|nr:hypothetical protein I7I52_06039 [Histoplasma capsulatum]QSS73662.1 hypothetical protein I7I50_08524 [Histoplasma capsulatum G186AR]
MRRWVTSSGNLLAGFTPLAIRSPTTPICRRLWGNGSLCLSGPEPLKQPLNHPRKQPLNTSPARDCW